MSDNNKVLTNIREGIISGLPIVFGYFPVSVAFGLLSRSIDISLKDSSLFSILVFAGASQFMALDLIKAGIAAGDIILATFLLNLRHFMMSASLSVRIKNSKKRWLPLIAFGITDETFSVSSIKGGELSVSFLLALHFTAYSAWVLGTVAGYLAGSALPAEFQSSLSIGLYAMFAALLVPEARKSLNVIKLALISAAVYLLITYLNLLSSGWSLIVTIAAASGLGLVFIKEDGEEEQQ
jgi:4-azaleucine resistance transporter AzlC